jgi:hypothetical protein
VGVTGTLIEFAVRAAPQEKGCKLTNGAGLHLFVAPGGTRSWRYNYQLDARSVASSSADFPRCPSSGRGRCGTTLVASCVKVAIQASNRSERVMPGR